MRRRARVWAAPIAIALILLTAPAAAADAPGHTPPTGGASTAPPASTPANTQAKSNGNCSAGSLAVNALNPFSHCNAVSQTVNGVSQLPGDAGAAAAGLAGGVMDQVASWMVGAAQTVDGDVMKVMTATSTPELSTAWYQQEFGYLAFFGAGLAGIVALLGLLSASVRGDPQAIGEVFYGIVRAGLVTAMVIALTLLALKVADGISSDVSQHMPRQFSQTLSSAWGAKGWGGLGSSALAFIGALVEVFVAVCLWIELLFRDAAIYVAVLFFPLTLAMAIWPRLSGTHAKLTRLLGTFIAFKPVALIIMMTGANMLLGGVTFYGGLGPSVGAIFAGLVVLAMAAFAPWALMHLAGLEIGSMGSSSRGRLGGGTGSSERGAGALGGELYGGQVTAGGVAAATAAAAGAGAIDASAAIGGSGHGGAAGARGSDLVSGTSPQTGGGAGGNGGGSRILPGPLAAAAGMLPAGWQATQSLATKGQWLADHGAARMQTMAGHGGSRPALAALPGAPTAASPSHTSVGSSGAAHSLASEEPISAHDGATPTFAPDVASSPAPQPEDASIADPPPPAGPAPAPLPKEEA